MSEYINETGARLAALRKENGFTQKEVAEKIGIHEKSYNVFEVGRRKKSGKIGESTRPEKEPVNISNAHLCALADLYGVSVDYLLGRTEYRSINGADIARITGLSDHAISVLQLCGGDNPMMYHHARDVSRILADWDRYGAESLLAVLTNYAQCAPGEIILGAVKMDIETAYLYRIAAAAEIYKADFEKEMNAARTDRGGAAE